MVQVPPLNVIISHSPHYHHGILKLKGGIANLLGLLQYTKYLKVLVRAPEEIINLIHIPWSSLYLGFGMSTFKEEDETAMALLSSWAITKD